MKYVKIIGGAGLVIILFLLIFSLENLRKRIPVELDIVVIEKGKSIGRNAMLKYLLESNQIDSVSIELSRLLEIEDSLQTNIK